MDEKQVAKLLADAQVGIGAALKGMKKGGAEISVLPPGMETAAGNLGCDSGCDSSAIGLKVKRISELEDLAATKGGRLELQKILLEGPEVAGHNIGCDSGCGSEAFLGTTR